MAKNESSIDILQNIANRAGWVIDIREEQQHFRVGNNLRTVIIKNPNIQNSYFISAQTNSMGKYRIYRGLLFSIKPLEN